MKFKMSELTIMITTHQAWDWGMPKPRGGNRHAEEIANFWRAFAKCQALYEKKCTNKECDKNKTSSVSPETAKKVVTGVAYGTILYWIISEGSRLFPPRNLVPIP